nr:hypothetical protein [candidate division Zixibacteria bacterium]NIR67076.1 hypothetical protein [candidate division Zixibacteria bacterium]NIS15685.1 hypothetical protein [candidate division Zixibacteria bacterium]NIS48487.1 hypothetical protein [candidate division Zixibacteria bacterium]NIT52187.1 hypothetical protein [candidate division Zixibacteria bacterium]
MGNRVKSQKPPAVLIHCLALFVFFGAPLYALDYTYDEDAGTLYSQALDLYRQDRFEEAAGEFSKLISNYPYEA